MMHADTTTSKRAAAAVLQKQETGSFVAADRNVKLHRGQRLNGQPLGGAIVR